MSTSETALEAGRYYHIYSHAVGDTELFLADDDRNHFLALLAKHTPKAMQALCYCLLGNHFHLLSQIHSEPVLKPHLALSHALNAYTQYFNRKNGRRGTLFQRPFKRKEITDQQYLIQVIAYIHLNPVHHGLFPDFEGYRWSSYRSLLSSRPTLLSRAEALAALGGRKSFIDYHLNYKNHLTSDWMLEDTP